MPFVALCEVGQSSPLTGATPGTAISLMNGIGRKLPTKRNCPCDIRYRRRSGHSKRVFETR